MHFDYYPFGMLVPKRHGNSTGYRFGFGGKEKDDELKGIGNSYDFGDRILDPRIGRWLSLDPLQEKYPWISPYHYVSNSPISKIDIDGQWDIEVHAYKDRAKYGFAVLIVKNRLGEEVYRTTVRVQGMNHKDNNYNARNRNMKYGDTPTGKYKIGDSQGVWVAKTSKEDIEVYGPNPLLRLDYVEGEGEGRNQMHVHGGRQEGKVIKDNGEGLWNTGGCMRIKDADLLEMKNITDALEKSDSEEKPNLLNVNDDLEYKDGEYKVPISTNTTLNKVKAKKAENIVKEKETDLEVKDEIPTFKPKIIDKKFKSKKGQKELTNEVLKEMLKKKTPSK